MTQANPWRCQQADDGEENHDLPDDPHTTNPVFSESGLTSTVRSLTLTTLHPFTFLQQFNFQAKTVVSDAE
jgi:hypothetical protein